MPSGRIWLAVPTNVLEELKSTSWKPSTSSFEALRFYNEGVRLTAGRNTHPGGVEELRDGDERRPELRAGVFRRRLRFILSAGYDDEAAQASRQAMSLARQPAAAGEASHRGQPLSDRERHRQGDRVLREPREGSPRRRDHPVRSRRALRTERRARPGARALLKGRRARSQVRPGTARRWAASRSSKATRSPRSSIWTRR